MADNQNPILWPNPNFVGNQFLAPNSVPAAPSQPQSEAAKLIADLAQINAANNNPDAMAALTLSQDRGNRLTANNQLLKDYRSMTPVDFQRRYGQEIYDQLVGTGIGGHHVRELAETERTPVQHLRDFAVDALSGAAQGALGLHAFAIKGMFAGELSNRMMKGNQIMSEAVQKFTDSLHSSEWDRRNYVAGIRNHLDNADSDQQYEEDKAKNGELIASLRDFGRGVISTVARVAEDPFILEKGVSEGVGSMLLGGPTSRVIGNAAKGANRALVPGTMPLSARFVEEAIDRVTFPMAIGGMEGGSNAADAFREVMTMPLEELQKQPEYQQLVASGLSSEEARARLADRASAIALSISTPVAALTGRMVEGIEKAPFSRGAGGSLAKDMSKEFAEESIQSGVGQLSSNIGQRLAGANDSLALSQGVGQATLEGGLFGAGAPVVTRSPGMAARGVSKIVSATLDATVGNILRRGDAVQTEIQNESETSAANLSVSVAQQAEAAPVVAENLKTMATEAGAKGEDVDAYISRIQNASNTNPEEYANLTPAVLDLVKEFSQAASQAEGREQVRLPNRFEALHLMSEVLKSDETSEMDKVAAGTFIARSIQDNQSLIDETPEFLNKIPQDRAEYLQFREYAKIVNSIKEEPEIKKALEWVEKQMQTPAVEETTDFSTPEGQQIVSTTVNAAAVAPQAVNPNTARVILQQADSGSLNLDANQRRMLRASLALQESAAIRAVNNRVMEPAMLERELAALVQELNEESRRGELIKLISKQIETVGGDRGHQKSLVDHAREINQAIAQGNPKEAKERIQNLGLFARSMRNKLVAMNQAIANGDRQKVPYRALGANGRWLPADGFFSVYFNPGSQASEKLARAIYADALSVAHLANEYARQFPEFGIQEVAVPPLALDQVQTTKPTQASDTKKGSSTPEQKTPSQATTSERTETVQEELPSSPSNTTEAKPESKALVEKNNAADTSDTIAEASSESLVEETEEMVSEDEPVEEEAPRKGLADRMDETSPEPEAKTVKSVFPNLVQVNGINPFHEAFKLPAEARTRLTELVDPLFDVAEAIRDGLKGITDLMGKNFSYEVKDQDRANLRNLMRLAAAGVDAAERRLNKVAQKKRLKERLEKGETDPLYYPELRAFAIAEPDGNGFRYNPQLIQSAMMAGLDWLMNTHSRSIRPDIEEIADFMGVDLAIAARFKDDFARGMSADMAVRGLTDTIRKFWGITNNPDADIALTTGIPEGVAKEVLTSLQQQGLIAFGQIDAREVNGKTYNRVWFDENPESEQSQLLKRLQGVHDFFGDVALLNNAKEGFSVGEPISEISERQLRNPLVETTPQQKKALENYQKTPFRLNRTMFEFARAMGKERYVGLMSGHPYKEGDFKKTHIEMGMNKMHWESVKGLQRTLAASYDAVARYVDAIDNSTSEDPAVYFKYEINRLGRQQMAGLNNPQTDKLIRELLMPNRAEVDLSSTDSQMFENFLTSAFQGLGQKPEKYSFAEIRTKMDELVLGEGATYRAALDAVKEWLQSDREQMPESLDGHLKGLTNHGHNALLALAKYELARDNDPESLKNFEVFGYVEADGISNGPINALMMYGYGEFNQNWLEHVAKGGAFIGNKGKTIDQHKKLDGVDLYQAAADKAQENIQALSQELSKTNDEVHQQFLALQNILHTLGITGYSFKDGELVLDRGVAKNPLTITGYGSGIDGIAGNMTDEILKAYYEELTSLAQGGAAIIPNNAALDMLLTRKIGRNSKTNKLFVSSSNGTGPKGSPLEFEVSSEQYQILKSNVRFLLTEPLVQGIEDIFSKEIKPTTETIQKASQYQSIIWKAMQQKELARSLAERKANPEATGYRHGFLVSNKEMDRIYRETLKWAPFYDTGTQRYLTAGGERAELLPKVAIRTSSGKVENVSMVEHYSLSLEGKLSTSAYVYGATLAGVKVIPTTVVGSGDGQMTLNIASSGSELVSRAVQIFDGINLPVDKIREFSTEINESVFRTWTTNANPVRAIQYSFRKFLENNPIETLFPADQTELDDIQRKALWEISQAYHGKFTLASNEMLSIEEAKMALLNLYEELMDVANSTDARRRTMEEFPFTVDQLASAKSPFVNEGKIQLPENISESELLRLMNERYDFHLASIQKTFRNDKLLSKEAKALEPVPAPEMSVTLRAVPQKKTQRLDQFINDRAMQDDETGTQILHVRQLANLADQVALAPGQKELLEAAVEFLRKDNMLLVFGSRKNLDAWEGVYNADFYEPGNNNNFGKYDPQAKIITMSKRSRETLVHELIHAATWDKVALYYSARHELSRQDQDALHRIEGLLEEWMDNQDQDSLDPAYITIRDAQISGRQDVAVNEFMAWVLTNQKLATQARRMKIKNPLFRIVGEALQALRDLIFGGKGPKVGADILSNLRFNTQILMSTPSPVKAMKKASLQMAGYQSQAFGSNDRLSRLREMIHNRITAWIAEPTPEELKAQGPAGFTKARKRQYGTEMKRARELATIFAEHFPELGNMQAFSTFTQIQAVLMTDMDLDGNALSRMEDLYSHVMDSLEVEDFRKNDNPNDQNDIYQAQEKLNTLSGVNGILTDNQGRSSLLSSFLALALVSDEFREILSKKDLPKIVTSKERTVDDVIENLGQTALDRLSMWMSGTSKADGNVREALDALAETIFRNVEEQKIFIANKAEGLLSGADKYLADNIQNLSDKVAQKTSDILKSDRNVVTRLSAGLVNLAATLINEKRAEELEIGITSWLNKKEGFNAFRALVNDMIGSTRENQSIMDLISKVKHEVSQARQQFRDELPVKLAAAFKKAPTENQWTAMFKSLGKSDIASIVGAYGVSGALDLVVNDKARAREIANLENAIQKEDPRRWSMVQQKSRQLAHKMNTGEDGVMLLANAEAIARLLGINGMSRIIPPSQKYVDNIDRLVTLYAIEDLDAGTKDSMSELLAQEKDGLEFIVSYLVGQRNEEMSKIKKTTRAIFNHYKGAIPSENQQGGSMIIAPVSEHARLIKTGYRRGKDYNGSSAEIGAVKRAYYFAPVSGRAAFMQGILQTVHDTASGVDPRTGYTVGEVIGGRILNPKTIRRIHAQIQNQTVTNENLRPVFGEKGEIVAFERMPDPRELTKLNRNTNLAKMIGVWRGRQMEEFLAREVNKVTVHRLYDIYTNAPNNRKNEFVNLLDLPDDPVLKDAVSLLPYEVREQAQELFGPDQFWVRRDMLLDVLGERQASIGDMFTGQTRWDPKVAQTFERIAMGLFGTFGNGRDAYKYLVSLEKNTQEAVSLVKTTIVVKSVIVPMANLISNMFQLLNRGVPLIHIARGAAKKTAEINTYIKSRKMEVDLEADLRAAEGRNDIREVNRIKNRIRSLQDSYRRMSIWPLIEAGEFSAISNGQVTAEDLALADGKWSSWIEKKINSLPPYLSTPLRYGFVTRDTALYKGLARSVQYGDFVAKAILYDDLTKRKGMQPMDAIRQARDAYVNYNRLAGRTRQWNESMGLIWFWNFKLRIMKEAAYTLRHNPLRSLLLPMVPSVPGLGNVGLPVTDNFLSVLMDGRLDYSIGPEMAWNGLSLNPWLNIAR